MSEKLAREVAKGIRALIEEYKDDSLFESFVYHDALRLESSLDQFFDLTEEGIGDRLRETALELVEWIEQTKEALIAPSPDLDKLVKAVRTAIEARRAFQEGEGSGDRLETAGAIIHWIKSLRDPKDGAITYPPRSLLDLADKWIEEGEK
jgi:hypothetical protein